jgi:16S rRNA G1207 methylase RsmC
VVDQILLTGNIVDARKELGFFETPPAVIARLLAIADVRRTHRVLEPSAGEGAIAKEILPILRFGGDLSVVEIDANRMTKLRKTLEAIPDTGVAPPRFIRGDFLSIESTPVFDTIVMNPPFARQADVEHVRHAAGFLTVGGRLVAVMSAGITFRQDAKAREFRAFLEEHDADVEELPPDSFRSSGTSINAVIVSFDHP